MNSRPLVSAIIPAFNAETFIVDAIESVLTQTYDPIECIVVDDGSTDETAAKAGSFGDGVRVISIPNGGVSRARNVGLSEARGKYVAFLDADDLWLPSKTQAQMDEVLRRPGVGVVYSALHLIDVDGRFIGRLEAPPPSAALWNTLLLEDAPVRIAQTGLLPTQVALEGGGFDESLSTSADCEFACRILAQSESACVHRPLAAYRVHRDQMHADPTRTEEDMERVFEMMFGSELLSAHLDKQERRARANLYISIAGRYLMKKDRRSFLRYARRAFLSRPDRVVSAIRRLSRPGAGLSRGQ